MGIDAEMLIKWRGAKPTDEMLNRWSWDLCGALGAQTFFIEDGLPPDQYRPKLKAWHEAFKEHPLHAEFDSAPSGDRRSEIHKRMCDDIGQPPKMRRRAIDLTNTAYPLDDGEDHEVPATHLAPGRAYIQDGDPILADDSEWFMEVNLWGRYYGPGYERGEILKYCAVAEWLEQNLPGCVVYYGGDSSGVCAEPFDAVKRAEYRAHLYSDKGRDYFKESVRLGRSTQTRPTPCSLCIPGEDRFNQYGFGANYAAVSCAGCGKNFMSRDNGKTWEIRKDGD